MSSYFSFVPIFFCHDSQIFGLLGRVGLGVGYSGSHTFVTGAKSHAYLITFVLIVVGVYTLPSLFSQSLLPRHLYPLSAGYSAAFPQTTKGKGLCVVKDVRSS